MRFPPTDRPQLAASSQSLTVVIVAFIVEVEAIQFAISRVVRINLLNEVYVVATPPLAHFVRSCYSTDAENRRGRIGKPGQFLETGISIRRFADPRPDGVTNSSRCRWVAKG
jgi:hypothetical protein